MIAGTRQPDPGEHARRSALRVIVSCALMTAMGVGSFACSSTANDDAREIPSSTVREGACAPSRFVFTVGSDIYETGPDSGTRLIAATEAEPVGPMLFDAGADVLYAVAIDDREPALRAYRLADDGSESEIARGVIDIVGVSAQGVLAYISERGPEPLELIERSPDGGTRVVASRVGVVRSDTELTTYAFSALLDSGPAPRVGLFVSRDGAAPRLVEAVAPERAVEPLAVTHDRVLYAALPSGSANAGTLIEWDASSDQTHTVSHDAAFLTADSRLDSVIAELRSEQDAGAGPVVRFERASDGSWTRRQLDTPDRRTQLAAWFLNGGRHTLALEFATDQADRLRRYDSDSGAEYARFTSSRDQAIAGVSVVEDGACVALILQSMGTGDGPGAQQETLIAFDAELGGQTVLAESRLDRGGGRVRVAPVRASAGP